MLLNQNFWDAHCPENLPKLLYQHHINYNDSDNKLHNVGRAVIHKYKSPYILESIIDNNSTNRLNSLTHCQKCSSPFKQPVTLSCGYTICLNCLPLSSQCLSFSCLRTHQNINCKPTVLLENILAQFTPTEDADMSQLKVLLNCSICLSTLIDPITTQCGHTFCKECLIRAMTDMKTRFCPFCRTELSRIGKGNQIICDWLDYLNNNLYYFQNDDEDQPQQQHIPIIQFTSAVAFPTQHCLIHIAKDNRSLLKYMVKHPHKTHYAICVFSKHTSSPLPTTNEFFEQGILLQINHVEYSPDIRHSVVQAIGLFRLRIHHLTVDVDNCYTGDVTRLDDLVENQGDEFVIDRQILEQAKNKRWTMPTTVITFQSTSPTPNTSSSTINILENSLKIPANVISSSTGKVIRPRPCSMRLSTSAPNNYQYTASENYGSSSRRAWATLMHKPPSRPLSFNTVKKSPQLQPNMTKITHCSTGNTTTTTINALFEQELHPYIVNYLTCIGNNIWIMKYDWHLQQSNLTNLIWWVANTLPLNYNEKIHILSMETLRERVMTLIVWADKWRL